MLGCFVGALLTVCTCVLAWRVRAGAGRSKESEDAKTGSGKEVGGAAAGREKQDELSTNCKDSDINGPSYSSLSPRKIPLDNTPKMSDEGSRHSTTLPSSKDASIDSEVSSKCCDIVNDCSKSVNLKTADQDSRSGMMFEHELQRMLPSEEMTDSANQSRTSFNGPHLPSYQRTATCKQPPITAIRKLSETTFLGPVSVAMECRDHDCKVLFSLVCNTV